MSITILISYATGTQRLLRACLESIRRYNAGVDYHIEVITEDGYVDEVLEIGKNIGLSVSSYQVPEEAIGSQRHAALLDGYMEEAEGLVLTMDSDCLPIANGWLRELCDMNSFENGQILPGIKWPWEPPGKDVTGMEKRIRSNQNWLNTWVACQLVDVEWLKNIKMKYSSGDDTGFAIVTMARSLGYKFPGWLPTRCALPEGDIDPELNRMICVAYGDKIVHIGGGSGKATGRVIDRDGAYDKAIERILTEKSAEWMLSDRESHKYSFDREDEVVEYKMRMMYNEMKKYLETHDSLFGS